jgi:peptidylprolyl isomerase
MAQAKRGDTVSVHYTGKLADDTVFGTTANHEPLQFTIGARQIMPGFEQVVIGMQPGETKTATVAAKHAYGQYNPELVTQVDRAQFDMQPEVGQQVQINQVGGQPLTAWVTEVSRSRVTLDANHPLAGQELIFDLQLLEIQ